MIDAVLRHEQMLLREQILRVQAMILIENGVDTGHNRHELLKRIGDDADENGKKLTSYHDALRQVQRARPIVSDKNEAGDHG